ncbi:hypothetical protein QA640_39435 [Bradyrhizobium sp. CB82]|uniref:hypothetical protein n=1 Tax=Bradyrhizobium sp. CB82 TaxID=3039159 RepID=UPI0024B1167F|nr:hypothetical protein [Bradyrhizobium sp. CB82]WFU40209.1 hypothetical protein QA640_39435 [Bradyrhizobium sp. CB82]
MKMSRALLAFVAATGLTRSITVPANAAPWTRGFVVSELGYAFRYGGRTDFKRGAEVEPGVDCPHGSSTHFATPDKIRTALARQAWRSQQEIDRIIAPPELDQAGNPGGARHQICERAIAYRGYNRGIETYVNPWAAEDTGQPEVTSRIGDGFDLDGKIGPHDFVGADGEKGIDNALYRAWGCDAPWRGDGNSVFNLRINEALRSGLYTIVIRISGNQDPVNDSDATVEIGYSPDKIVKDARNSIAADYSYRILKSTQYTKLKATVKNGVVQTEQVEHLHMPRIAWFDRQKGDADFINGRMRLNIDPDDLGTRGMIGGYRSWRDIYAENSFKAYGGRADTTWHEDHVALYYALRRNADGIYNEKTGQYDGISTVYRPRMSPVFVVDPDISIDLPMSADEQRRVNAFEAVRTNFIKSVEARTPQDVPPGNGEAQYPLFERATKDLPSRDYFLKTLDRPHYPYGVGTDEFNNPIDDEGNCIDRTVACASR